MRKLKNITEEDIIMYIKKKGGWVDDQDLHINFIPEESDAYFGLHLLVDSLVASGKLSKTSAGYRLN